MSENITPAYREEKLLANIAGEDYDITPATRKEKLLAEIQGQLSEIQGLPDTTGASVGDVLTIGSDGPEWAAAGGGGSDNVRLLSGGVNLWEQVGSLTIQPGASGIAQFNSEAFAADLVAAGYDEDTDYIIYGSMAFSVNPAGLSLVSFSMGQYPTLTLFNRTENPVQLSNAIITMSYIIIRMMVEE